MPARSGQRPNIPTPDLLEAVAWLGPRWTLLFTTWEITSINEALDRELLTGNLEDALSLTPQGERVLDAARGSRQRGRIDFRGDVACRDHDDCFVVTCRRCDDLRLEHVAAVRLEEVVRKIIADHICVTTT